MRSMALVSRSLTLTGPPVFGRASAIWKICRSASSRISAALRPSGLNALSAISVADADQLPQGRAFTHDLRIGLDVGDRRDVFCQLTEVTEAADLGGLAFLVQLLGQGHHVDRRVLIGQTWRSHGKSNGGHVDRNRHPKPDRARVPRHCCPASNHRARPVRPRWNAAAP